MVYYAKIAIKFFINLVKAYVKVFILELKVKVKLLFPMMDLKSQVKNQKQSQVIINIF